MKRFQFDAGKQGLTPTNASDISSLKITYSGTQSIV